MVRARQVVDQFAQLDDLDLQVLTRAETAARVAAAIWSATWRVVDRTQAGGDDGQGTHYFLLCGLTRVDQEVRGVAVLLEEAWVGGSEDVIRAAGLHAAADLRDDLLAQDLDLLEDDLQRQAGVVDEEQLALVIADPIGELHGALDDLLDGADGQRRHLGELLQRRAVAVDRGVVEVGAEELLRLFLGVADEDLAAEAHDRLVGLAVAVLLEAAAVDAHHFRRVLLPEDVVVEEAVAVERGCSAICTERIEPCHTNSGGVSGHGVDT